MERQKTRHGSGLLSKIKVEERQASRLRIVLRRLQPERRRLSREVPQMRAKEP